MRRTGELPKATIDRHWPHQVAIEEAHCTGRMYDRIHDFCRPLSLAPLGHTFRENDCWMNVYCFAERAHAELLLAEFGGRIIDPKDRPRWPGKRRR